MRKLVIVMLAAILLPVTSFADEMGPGKKRMDPLKELRLDLAKDQIEKLRALHREKEKKWSSYEVRWN
jgi:hypothetical protein